MDGEFLGGNYLIKNGPIYTDENGEFSMALEIYRREKFVAPDSAITVISPNGGEDFEPGSTQEITWENNYDPIGFFKIFYSKNNGADWNFITFESGSSMDWTVPDDVDSENCRVKVEHYAKTYLNDISDSSFTIRDPTSIDHTLINDGVPKEFK